MKSFILLSICLASLSAPVIEDVMEKKEEQVLTVEGLDGYIDMLKMFRGMLPNDLMTTLDNLNMTEKGELVSFLSDWYHGRIKKPENKAEIVELIQEKLPTEKEYERITKFISIQVYDKIDALNTTFYSKFLKLKPETQELLRSARFEPASRAMRGGVMLDH
ncbi:unnamed protein product [Nippostrongylus brasiliensis]|uniref:DUF2059 domain-containing protein n=1 Tax=Nippostrongylus brasiliensis TaxID=27835 RepID=A0A0N4XH33_NIPBR|nr:unnamed protein product [Nippostrongylus brasiliensis]